jgi:anti-anti-sigma factor
MSALADRPAKVERNDNVTIITFMGGNDRTTENMIVDELEAQKSVSGARHLLLDFTNVAFLGSLELGTLITLDRKVKSAGGRLTLFNLNDRIYEVIQVTGLERLLGICREETPAVHHELQI